MFAIVRIPSIIEDNVLTRHAHMMLLGEIPRIRRRRWWRRLRLHHLLLLLLLGDGMHHTHLGWRRLMLVGQRQRTVTGTPFASPSGMPDGIVRRVMARNLRGSHRGWRTVLPATFAERTSGYRYWKDIETIKIQDIS